MNRDFSHVTPTDMAKLDPKMFSLLLPCIIDWYQASRTSVEEAAVEIAEGAEFEMRTLADLLPLSESTILRLLPDLLSWHGIAHEVIQAGAETASFCWVNDGVPGVLEVNLKSVETGEVTRAWPLT